VRGKCVEVLDVPIISLVAVVVVVVVCYMMCKEEVIEKKAESRNQVGM